VCTEQLGTLAVGWNKEYGEEAQVLWPEDPLGIHIEKELEVTTCSFDRMMSWRQPRKGNLVRRSERSTGGVYSRLFDETFQ
jgi:hypothetical protein